MKKLGRWVVGAAILAVIGVASLMGVVDFGAARPSDVSWGYATTGHIAR
jgi:hypothetical protein